MKKIIIVGAGASGVYLSILLKQSLACEVIVLEQNTAPLKKLLATGNGRCNLSNSDMSIQYYQSDNLELVNDIIMQFNMEEAMNDIGLLCTHMNNLLYPRSEQALSVKNVMMDKANALGVVFIYEQEVIGLSYDKAITVKTKDQTYKCDDLVLAMGSEAGKLSGINQSRYDILNKLKLKVIEPMPSLVQMNTKPILKQLKGVRVKGTFTLLENNQAIHKEKGELLFTDYGVSGIAIMQLSSFFNKNHKYELSLDLFDDFDERELYNLIESRKDKGYNHIYDGLVNSKIAHYLETQAFKNTKECVRYLKDLRLKVVGLRDYQTAQVMKGGLSLQEVNQYLQIKKYPHIYITGELCNVVGMCGGYNLHYAFASAKRVVEGIKKEYHA